jgi:D-arabinose 1-dehydrogenase-like Zn-dependent alcohol dehydrogenase
MKALYSLDSAAQAYRDMQRGNVRGRAIVVP